MTGKAFIREWTELGELIAQGGQIDRSAMYAIYDNLNIGHIKPNFLPNELTITGTALERKKAIFSMAQNLWGLTPDDWLLIEKYKLQDARKVSGSNETGGKDKHSDVVSAELMLRIVATAKLVYEDKHDKEISDEAVRALNVILAEVCAKGRTRMTMIDDKSVYTHLKKGGLMIGTGGGKYLPYPEKSLPYLFLLLHKELIRPEAYFE
jgi:hypothetical protein